MASTTPNIGLTLPTGTEGWQRSVINGNFEILDTKIGAVGNTSLQDQVTALSSKLVKSANVTGTTDSNGALQLTGISTSTHTVLAAATTNRIAVVFVYNTTWNVKVFNISNFSPVTDTSVTVTYFYVQ